MMLSTAFVLLALVSISTSNFYSPKNSSYACTQSSATSGELQFYCLKNKSSGAGFNVTVHSTKRINVECQNSLDWIDFLLDNKLGLRPIDQLVLSGCELAEAEFVGRKFGDARVQFLEVKALKGRVSRQRLDVFPGLDALALTNNILGKVDADLLYRQRHLTKLSLRATQIKIPASFFVKSRFLTHLDLSDNDLHDLEPGLFDGLENLRTLNLSRNSLKFLLPGQFRGLFSLGYLDLSDSRLYALPNKIFQDTTNHTSALTLLDLSENGLRYMEPGLFDGLVNLRSLNLSNNVFDFLQPKLFRGLSSLGYLDLSESHIDELVADIFRDTVNLTSVNLSGNQFERIPGNLFSHGLAKLKYVKLARNKLNMTELPSKLFADLPSLKVASLEGLKVRRLPEDLFHGSFGIVEINLSEDELEALPHNLLRDARELRKFNVSSNKLQALPDQFFARANKLMGLDLSKNRIPVLDRQFSDGLHALLEINMEDNELEYMHSDAFRWLGHLKIAKLARNRLTFRSYYKGEMSPLHHCKRLEILDFSRNEIAEMFADWVHSHDRLRRLDLSFNELNYVGMDDLEFASDRLSLDLSHNNIAIVNVSTFYLRNHSSSITINLSGNPIDCHCQVYPLQRYAVNSSAYAHVKLLVDDITCRRPPRLRGARLSELDNKKLECASVNGRSNLCVSEEACHSSIVPASRMLMIDCARKNLSEAPAWIRSLDDLFVSLDLSGNALTRVPKMTSNGYGRVNSLNLADNLITSIDKNLFSTNLTELHLDGNRLSSIDQRLMQNLVTSGLESVWLGNNPWICDRSTQPFRIYLQDIASSTLRDKDSMICINTGKPVFHEIINVLPEYFVYYKEATDQVIFISICVCILVICSLFQRFRDLILLR